jgi:hypothetical protein
MGRLLRRQFTFNKFPRLFAQVHFWRMLGSADPHDAATVAIKATHHFSARHKDKATDLVDEILGGDLEGLLGG